VVAGVFENTSEQSVLIDKFFQEKFLDRIDSLLVGPGLGPSKESWDETFSILKEFSGLLVLDADALNRLSISKEGWKWLKRRKGVTVITPHEKEFKRLFKGLDFSDPLNAAQEAACISGVGVLLKGAHSVFVSPAGDVWQLGETAPWAARAGSGDLLAGFIAGVGSIGLASSQEFDWSLFAASALMHSEAALNSIYGSTASEIGELLATYVQRINSEKCFEKDI